MESILSLTRIFDFSASHLLSRPDWSEEKNLEVFGKCSNSAGHGHNYVLEVTVAGTMHVDTQMVIDAALLKSIVESNVIADVDHKFLNTQVPWLTGQLPTVELLCDAFWKRIEIPIQTACPNASLSSIRLWETPRIVACKGKR